MGTPASNTPQSYQEIVLPYAQSLLGASSTDQTFEILGHFLPLSLPEQDVSIWALERRRAHYVRYEVGEQGLIGESAMVIDLPALDPELFQGEAGLLEDKLPGEALQANPSRRIYAYPIFIAQELCVVIYLGVAQRDTRLLGPADMTDSLLTLFAEAYKQQKRSAKQQNRKVPHISSSEDTTQKVDRQQSTFEREIVLARFEMVLNTIEFGILF
ncbi:MAG: hypothetical protein AAGM67_06025, partial [Bacteroidota bacterium]